MQKKIGLIDVDGHNFPNLPLMKLSAWHKNQEHDVTWYEPLFSGHMDRVYISKVFTFTPDYAWFIHAEEVIKGGTGYYYPAGGACLPEEVEQIYPDYGLYEQYTKNTAYGFLTRGCPRGCQFCIVGIKEGTCSKKVADLSTFWKGQKNIVLLDPNITAYADWMEPFGQLIDSGAWVNFSQGLDIRLMTAKKAELLKKMKVKQVHFAWDNYNDRTVIIDKLKEFKACTGWNIRKMIVYVLVNYDTTLEQDLERIYTIRDLGYWPFVMIYEKEKLPPRHILKKLQRWVNMRAVFQTVHKFEDYLDK